MREQEPRKETNFRLVPLDSDAVFSTQTKKTPYLEDYLFPAELIPFPSSIPPYQQESRPPHKMMATACEYINLEKIFYNTRSSDTIVGDHCELALISQTDGLPARLAVQLHRSKRIAREYVDPKRQSELMYIIETVYPEQYQRLRQGEKFDDPDVVVGSGFRTWSELQDMILFNEAFQVLSHVVNQAPSRSLFAESHHVETQDYKHGVNSNFFLITPIEVDGEQAFQVEAEVSQENIYFQSEESVHTSFIYFHDRVEFAEGELDRVLQETGHPIGARIADTVNYYHTDNLRYRLMEVWKEILYAVTVKKGHEFKLEDGIGTNKITDPTFVFKAFGQNLGFSEFRGTRIFDGAYEGPTLRPKQEIKQRVLFTHEEAKTEEERQAKEKMEFLTNILPSHLPWGELQIKEGADFIERNNVDTIDLIQGQLSAGKRLVMLGMPVSLQGETLPVDILKQVPEITFVAVEKRIPTDSTSRFNDAIDFVQVDEGGIIVETDRKGFEDSHPEAVKETTHSDPVDTIYDQVVELAQQIGIDVLYVISGAEWKTLDKNIADQIGSYLKEHPQAKGIYFGNLLHTLYWSGADSKEDWEETDSDRPFINPYSFAHAHESDPSIRMAAYHLKKSFPNQIYSMAYFPLPKGFGREWASFRSSQQQADVKKRYALGPIRETPFAKEQYLYSPFPEVQGMIDDYAELTFTIQSLPPELVEKAEARIAELQEMLALYAGAFLGTQVMNWGNLIDSIVVNAMEQQSSNNKFAEEAAQEAIQILTKS